VTDKVPDKVSVTFLHYVAAIVAATFFYLFFNFFSKTLER